MVLNIAGRLADVAGAADEYRNNDDTAGE